MAQIYFQLIKKGIKTIKDVPVELRQEVEKLLEKDNLKSK